MNNFLLISRKIAAFLEKPTPDRNEWLLIIFLTIIFTLLIHGNALNGYWRFDDGVHLMFATRYSPWQYFFDPEITRLQSGSHVTPWNAFFYDISLFLSGFEPKTFYIHLLLLIIAIALALFSLLRIWFSLPATLLALLVFLTGKPTYHLAQELMCGHYLTGLLFSLLSLRIFVSYIRAGHSFKLLIGVIFYALATTCKEIYVPLIGLLLVLPVGFYQQRLRAMLPYVIVSIGYALWRHEVLGVWLGGYSPAMEDINYINIGQQLTNIPFLLFNSHSWESAGLIVLAVMSLVAFWNRQINISLLLVSIVIVFSPLIPLTLNPGINQADRYLFVPWVALSIWSACIFNRVNKRGRNNRIARPLSFCFITISALVFLGACFFGKTNEMQRMEDEIHKAEKLYHFALKTDFSRKALILDINDSDYWALMTSEARRANDMFNDITPILPLIVVNTLNGLLVLDSIVQSNRQNLSSLQFYTYRNSFTPLEIKPIIHSTLNALKTGENEKLKMEFHYNNGLLTWAFQPNNVAYSAIMRSKKDNSRYPIINLPQKGSYPWSNQETFQISLTFQSNQNWLAISPNIIFDPAQQVVIWEGKSDVDSVSKKLEFFLKLE